MRFCGGKSKLFQLATASPKGLRWSQSSYSTAKVPHALSHAVTKNIKVRTEVGEDFVRKSLHLVFMDGGASLACFPMELVLAFWIE